jgi:hypothetical protein
VEAVDLLTVGDALVFVGSPAVVGVRVAADAALAVLVAAVPDLVVTMGATVEMLLIGIVACLECVRRTLPRQESAASRKPLAVFRG